MFSIYLEKYALLMSEDMLISTELLLLGRWAKPDKFYPMTRYPSLSGSFKCVYLMLFACGCFLIWGYPSHHPFISRIFPHKPSILGVSPWLWKPIVNHIFTIHLPLSISTYINLILTMYQPYVSFPVRLLFVFLFDSDDCQGSWNQGFSQHQKAWSIISYLNL